VIYQSAAIPCIRTQTRVAALSRGVAAVEREVKVILEAILYGALIGTLTGVLAHWVLLRP
jgi:hypothetical protein